MRVHMHGSWHDASLTHCPLMYRQRCAEEGKDLSVCVVEKSAEVGEAPSCMACCGLA